MKILRWLFFPISLLYGLIMLIRNWAFDIGLLSQYRSKLKVIAIGNLSTGGTGKTPFTEYLLNQMKSDKIAVLSRGYGRSTSGYILAKASDSAETIGDEPYQMFRKFQPDVVFAVAEKRVEGLKELENIEPELETVILDDAFQHRYAQRDVNILLTSYDDLFVNDLMLPTGNLREPKIGARRADRVVVTKCPPNLSESEKKIIAKRISRYVSLENVFFSSIKYGEAVAFKESGLSLGDQATYLLTGIANPEPLIQQLNSRSLIDHFKYPDHYAFTEKDLDQLVVKVSEKKAPILTTEKDMVRLLEFSDHQIFEMVPFYYLPIAFQLDREKDFLNGLMMSLKGVKS